MTDQKQMESDQLLNYSTFTNSTFTNSIQVIVADDTEKPTTVLKQTDDTLKYRFAENLHFPLRHLWYLFEILIGIAVLLAFILPSLMIITLFSLLFRLLCCCCRNDDSNSLTIIYNDIHLWLISHKYSTCWNLPYFIFWHWLNYNVTFFLYVNYILLRTIGGIDGLYDSRKEMSDYYGDYQPFLGGLSCTNYSIVEQMMSDPNGGKGFVFQTLDVDIAKTFLKYSPVMLSTNTKEHLFSRGFFMAFLTPVFETIRDSNNSNNNNNSSTFNQEFDEIYAPRMAKLMESIRAEMIARGVKDGTSETDKELIEDVISSKQRQISRMAIHMLLFLFFWDEKQYTYVDLEKGDKTEGDIDRLIDNILDSWPALVLPTITYLPLAGIVIGQQKSLAEALRDLRNLFVENQNAPTMQSFIRYCDANDANVEEALYSLVSTIVIAAFLGLDESIAFGFKLFYQDFEKYNHEMFMQDKNRFIKEIIRYLGVRPGTNTLLLKQEQTLTIRGKNYKIPKNTPIMLLIGRANRDTTMFGDDVDSINPNRKGLDSNLLSWNGKEEYIISPDKEIQKKAPRFCPGHDVALFMISSVLEMGSRNKSVFDLDGPTRLNSTAKLIQEESFKDHVDVDKIHASLSFYNRTYGKIFVNNIKSVSAQREYDLLPKPINKYPERMRNEKGELKIREVKLFGVELHINDLYIENWGLIMTAIFDATKNFDTVLYPLKDDDELFYNKTKEPMKGKIKMKAIDRSRVMMKKYVRKKLHMPNVNVEWKEMKSNHAMSLFAFGGVVCHYTKVMDENDININSKAPKGSKYVHDVTWMYGYRVRKGLERYGGAAFFDDKCKLTGIYVSHLDKTFDARSDTSIDILYNDESKESVDSESDGKPDADVNANGNGADSDGNDLKYAKYVWLTSALASVTIKDHAFRSHLMESRALVQQLIQNLPLDHWLTRFLHIFTYRTVFINHNMYTLLLTVHCKYTPQIHTENGFVPRIWGFDHHEINKIGTDSLAAYKFVEYTKRFDPQLAELDDAIFPLNKDCNEFFEVMEKFVDDYLSHYHNELIDDEAVKLFFNGICRELRIDRDYPEMAEFNKMNLCTILTNLICIVTAFHEQVGSVMDNYCIELDWNDVKLYKNKKDKTQMSKNDFVMLALLVMLTGTRNPYIINDFTHVLVKDDNYDKNKRLFEVWQQDLKDLRDRIENRNKERRIAFNAINPRNLECSLSI